MLQSYPPFLFSFALALLRDKSSLSASIDLGMTTLYCAFLGVAVAIDFNRAFALFHKLLFPQGNWEFISPMTVVLNGRLFMAAAARILLGSLAFAVALLAGGFVLWKAKQR